MSETSKPKIGGDGSQGPPPTYDEAVDKIVDKTVDETTNPSTANQIQPTPGPAGNGKLFFDAPGETSIVLGFMPEPSIDEHHQTWYGQMNVKCGDVPLLMREGFHWTAANVVREQGFVEPIARNLVNRLGNPNRPCTVTRVWILRDLQQPPRWTAFLQIHAQHYEVLSGIRLDNWTIDMVQTAKAWGLSKKLIYQFDSSKPRCHFNCIYDDMPLEGWWPWPKSGTEIQVGCGFSKKG
ncbi:uncharacterized protein F4807DRAFT_463243 [Annulohypoxylon truncatum]|uniref:uncharacterized protein n=1 Tax=Annulohypoxylon truncatum TaxID=327061 RepID=UPI002007898B|nr:uncharacterized protein F4807DRAFT_463243 [Annulohypoxylon truncatum]KAI1206844.1 hypothetical protein F4807DRAFT_463243 [Annulohypoxylon truncatum]